MKHYSISHDNLMAYEMTTTGGEVKIRMIGPGGEAETEFRGGEAKAMQTAVLNNSKHCTKADFEAHSKRIKSGSPKIEKR